MITTAHAHKSGVILHIFPRAFKQKIFKAVRPKMTKIASRGGGPVKTRDFSGAFVYFAIQYIEYPLHYRFSRLDIYCITHLLD